MHTVVLQHVYWLHVHAYHYGSEILRNVKQVQTHVDHTLKYDSYCMASCLSCFCQKNFRNCSRVAWSMYKAWRNIRKLFDIHIHVYIHTKIFVCVCVQYYWDRLLPLLILALLLLLQILLSLFSVNITIIITLCVWWGSHNNMLTLGSCVFPS